MQKYNIHYLDSASELREHIINGGRGKYKLMLGEDGIVANSAAEIYIEESDTVIGIVSDGVIEPQVICVNDGYLIGYNNNVAYVKAGKIQDNYCLESSFYEFNSSFLMDGFILAIFETLVVVFDNDGMVNDKHYMDDIIESYERKDSFFRIKLLEGKEVDIKVF